MSFLRVTVLVEGYDDRAFWSGLLRKHLGFVASHELDGAEKKKLPSEVIRWLSSTHGVSGGYRYLNGHRLVEVIPFQEQRQGEEPLQVLFKKRVRERGKEIPLVGIIVVRDDDQPAGSAPPHHLDSLKNWLEAEVPHKDITKDGAQGLLVDGLAVRSMTWRCDDPEVPELPRKQTLERLAFAAMNEVYPERTRSVRVWLATLPDQDSSSADHKASAGALWAGWHADNGWSWFYEGLWHDPEVAEELLRRIPDWDRTRALLLGS